MWSTMPGLVQMSLPSTTTPGWPLIFDGVGEVFVVRAEDIIPLHQAGLGDVIEIDRVLAAGKRNAFPAG